MRVKPLAPETVVDGSAGGLLGLAAFGALPLERPLAYAADLGPEEIRRAAAAGAELVVSDSNRRRVFVASRLRQVAGPTLAAADPIPRDAALLDPFSGRGAGAQTVAELSGARYVRAPFSPHRAQFPEHRPYAAFDGSPRTWWLADEALESYRHQVEVGFPRRRDVEHVDFLPSPSAVARVREVEVNGRRYPARPGWNRLRVGLRGVDALELRPIGPELPDYSGATGGFAEVRVPGLRVGERLRPPRLVERALAGRDLDRSSLTYLFERTTGDRPFRREAGPPPPPGKRLERGEDPEAHLVAGARDGEAELRRAFTPPAARRYAVDAWVSVAPDARDDLLDRSRSAGRLAAGCDSVRVRVGGRTVGLRPEGTVEDLAAGRPLRARACGGPLALPARRVSLETRGNGFRTHLLRLRSPAPQGLPAASGGGRVLDAGRQGRGVRDGVRVAVDGPAWLVLGESYNRAWRARCDGRDLGAPRPIDGYANGWRVGAGCRDVRFQLAANAFVKPLYAISAVGGLAMLAFLIFGRRRRPGPGGTPPPPLAAPGASPLWPLRRALVAGACAGAVLGFVFSIRAGVVIGPAVAVVLWRGVGPRALALAAGGLLAIAVPAIYLAFMPADRGGYNADYPMDLIGAHWVAVAAWVLLALALARTVAAALRGRGGRVSGASPASDAPAPSRPAAAGRPGPP